MCAEHASGNGTCMPACRVSNAGSSFSPQGSIRPSVFAASMRPGTQQGARAAAAPHSPLHTSPTAHTSTGYMASSGVNASCSGSSVASSPRGLTYAARATSLPAPPPPCTPFTSAHASTATSAGVVPSSLGLGSRTAAALLSSLSGPAFLGGSSSALVGGPMGQPGGMQASAGASMGRTVLPLSGGSGVHHGELLDPRPGHAPVTSRQPLMGGAAGGAGAAPGAYRTSLAASLSGSLSASEAVLARASQVRARTGVTSST